MTDVDAVRGAIEPLLLSDGYKFIDVTISGSTKSPLVRILIDREESFITIDDCVKVTRLAQDVLELRGVFKNEFRLEVSSPGVSYPLREPWQFRKNLGRRIGFAVETADDEDAGASRVEGLISAVDSEEGGISIDIDGVEKVFQLEEAAGAKIVFEKPKKRKKRKTT